MGPGGATEQGQRDCGAGRLTAREVEVLRLAAMGLPNIQIAAHLGISRRTVDDHLSEMLRRAQARDRGELIARSYAAQILVGWPPHCSGKRSLRIRQEPTYLSSDLDVVAPGKGVCGRSALGACQETVPKSRAVQITSDVRLLDTSCSAERARHGRGETVLGGVRSPGDTAALLGYARASVTAQAIGQQIDALRAVGCDFIFIDKTPGTERESDQLRRLLNHAQPGDVLVVERLGRLSRSFHDLIRVVIELHSQGLELRALHESLDTTTPGGRLNRPGVSGGSIS